MSEETKSKPYFGGIPIDIDVKKLQNAYPELKEGDIILYDAITELIQAKPYSRRYNTVITSWRKILLASYNICLKPAKIKYVVANPSERVGIARSKLTSGIRMTIRAGNLVDKTDLTRLDDPERKEAEHISYAASMMNQYRQIEKRRVRIELPEGKKA